MVQKFAMAGEHPAGLYQLDKGARGARVHAAGGSLSRRGSGPAAAPRAVPHWAYVTSRLIDTRTAATLTTAM